MPQFAAYPVITTLAADDVLLVSQDSSGGVKTISSENAAISLSNLGYQPLVVTQYTSSQSLGNEKVAVGNSASTITFLLPFAEDNEGDKKYIANRGTGTLTVSVQAGDTIDGLSSKALTQYKGVVVISLGNGLWQTFGS
jgi:hypothetical protein